MKSRQKASAVAILSWVVSLLFAMDTNTASAFDTAPWSSGPMNVGGMGALTRSNALGSAAQAHAAAIDKAMEKKTNATSVTTGNSGCIVNVGGIVGNSVGNNSVLVTQVIGNIVTVCQ